MALHNDVFRQQIWDFFCGDLQSCLCVSAIKQQSQTECCFKGGLNFTSALVIFSVIELASGWYKGKEPTTETVAEFFYEYFSEYYSPFKDKNFSKKFYGVFRNGLSHQWSPKASGIAMDFSADWFIKKVKYGSEEILMLNIPIFFKWTKLALKKFENDLDSKQVLRDSFEKRYKVIVDSDYKEMRVLRDMLKKLET